jgi:hypothetical protein
MKKVILISAKAQNGKTEFAKLLKEQLELKGERVVIMSFAKYIKGYMKDYFGWDGFTKDDSVRSKLQILGTEKIRQQMNMPNFHVNRVCEDIKVLEDDFDYFIIDDVRFFNEVHYPKAMFGDDVFDIRISRLNFKSSLTDEQLLHPSENDLDNFHFSYYISNTTLDNLKTEAIILANDLFNGELYV